VAATPFFKAKDSPVLYPPAPPPAARPEPPPPPPASTKYSTNVESVGVTEELAAEDIEVPLSLTACTVNVYAVSLVSPVNV
jgi:hypothetical protein